MESEHSNEVGDEAGTGFSSSSSSSSSSAAPAPAPAPAPALAPAPKPEEQIVFAVSNGNKVVGVYGGLRAATARFVAELAELTPLRRLLAYDYTCPNCDADDAHEHHHGDESDHDPNDCRPDCRAEEWVKALRAGAPGAIKALRVGEKIFRGGAKSSLVIQYTSSADRENWSDCGCCEPPSGEWLELRRMLVE